MKSYVELSQPPSDPPDPSDRQLLAGPTLRAAVKSLGLSNSEIAKGIGKSDTLISQWLNAKYPGDVASIEAALREWLRDRRVATATGVTTVETEVSKAICRKLEEIRINGEIGIIIGPAGIGKSRGEGLFLIDHTLAIGFRTRPWHSGKNGLADDLSAAAGIDRLKRGQKRWETIVEKTTGSGRLLVIDDAHELSQCGLQCAIDWAEQTGNPLALVGLELLKKKLLKDARRARRVADVHELTVKDPLPLLNHLITELAPDANGERSDLVSLCAQVAAKPGAFGAVEKQLKYAARSRKKKPGLQWVPAFRAAHLRLLRGYSL